LLHQYQYEIATLQATKEAFKVKEGALVERNYHTVLSASIEGMLKQKESMKTYGQSMTPCFTFSTKYAEYVHAVLEKELILRLGRLDNLNGIFPSCVKDVQQNIENLCQKVSAVEDVYTKKNVSVDKTLKKTLKVVNFILDPLVTIVCSYYNIGNDGQAVISAVASGASTLGGKVAGKTFNLLRERNRDEIVQDYVDHLDLHIQKIVKAKFQHVENAIKITLARTTDEIQHKTSLLENMQRSKHISEGPLEYVTLYFDVVYTLQKVADQFETHFI